MKLIVRTLAMAALVACLPAGTALAHRGGDDSRSSSGFTVSQAEAAALAFEQGMVTIYETKARRGVWKMEGYDASGAKLEVSVDGRSGQVVKVERYGSGFGSRSSRSGGNRGYDDRREK